MGRNNHNAGMRLIPNGYGYRTDMIDVKDKYCEMIVENNLKRNAESNLKRRMEDMSKIVADVELCNFITLMKERGERKNCLCGGKLNYYESLKIRFHSEGKMDHLMMSGKQCIDCERKFIVKKDFYKAYAECKKQKK